MLDAAGFEDAVISASNDLDENLISSLKAQGATIRSWGVGTHLITAKDNPSFGGVYKLAAIQQDDGSYLPKIKVSENTETRFSRMTAATCPRSRFPRIPRRSPTPATRRSTVFMRKPPAS